MFSSDPDQNHQVVVSYNETKSKLDSIKMQFDQAVQAISGVSSEAASALKAAVNTEVVPRMNTVLQQFGSLGDGLNSATVATIKAGMDGNAAVQNFRGALA